MPDEFELFDEFNEVYEVVDDSFSAEFPSLTSVQVVVNPPDDDEVELIYDEDYGVQVFALSPITSADGLKGILLDILGDYDGIVVQYRYQQNTTSTNYTYVNEIQPDYPWIASAVLFISLIWSIFMIGGRLLRTK